jgi:G:T-mismatch repair DNA endonuclease (very short patch repair protein)
VSRKPDAIKSALHRKVVSLVKEIYPNFTILEEEPVKVSVRGRQTTLFVDILIKELNVAIECHGQQHTKYVAHFHGSRDGFAGSQLRDQAKAQQLQELGYSFVVVHHHEQNRITAGDLLERMTKAIEGAS